MSKQRPALTLVELLVIVAILGMLIAFLLPPACSLSRYPSRCDQCLAKMRHINTALLSYESTNGQYPPAYTVDVEGNRLHSWRTLLLPHLEEQQLFDTIDFTKPWDHPVNKVASGSILDVYTCPSYFGEDGMTAYCAVIGPDTLLADPAGRKRSAVVNSAELTITFVEIDTDRAVPWMSPQDIQQDELLQDIEPARWQHKAIMQAAFLDGHVASLSVKSDSGELAKMLTISDGQEITK